MIAMSHGIAGIPVLRAQMPEPVPSPEYPPVQEPPPSDLPPMEDPMPGEDVPMPPIPDRLVRTALG